MVQIVIAQREVLIGGDAQPLACTFAGWPAGLCPVHEIALSNQTKCTLKSVGISCKFRAGALSSALFRRVEVPLPLE
jgi:hypothetical protein